MRTYEEATRTYTGGGKITTRVGYGSAPTVVAQESKFKGAQPQRTQTEKDELAATLAKWKTPEAKAHQLEYAANHPCDEDYDSDF